MAEEAQPVTEGGEEEPGGQEPAKELEGAAAPEKEGETLLTGGEKEEPEGAPESYEAFNLPEGAEVDDARLTEFSDLARESNLSQAAAQKFVDLYAGAMQAYAEQSAGAWDATQEQWVADARADKEFGGAKLDESLGYARKVLTQYGTRELSQALETTGMTNHPELIRVFSRIGRAISEGDISLGSTEGQKSERRDADILFDHPGTPR